MTQMKQIKSETTMSDQLLTSLLDLAQVDMTEVRVQARLQPKGIYITRLLTVGPFQEAGLGETNDKGESSHRFNLMVRGEILEYKPLSVDDKDAPNPESMVGKTYTEFLTIYATDAAVGLGRIKERLLSAHFQSQGPLGGVEGAAPGCLDAIAGQIVGIKVTHSGADSDNQRAWPNWLGAKALKKLGYDWEVMQRVPYDKNGEVLKLD